MNLEVLFEKIRKEEVILWIGAGFSIYAGMPSGNSLKSRIIKEILKYNKEHDLYYYQDKVLKDVAELFVRTCTSRFELNRILIECFTKNNSNTIYHDILSRLPFFKTIITTNYDSLIEASHQNRCCVVREPKDLPYIENKIPTIMKLHGDLESLDRIIITESDYAKSENFNNLLWNHVKSVCTNKDILFLGYSYEDPNVKDLFGKINEELKNHTRSKILIVPTLNDSNRISLKENKIDWIEMSGERFIQELEKNVNDNILSDVRKNLTSVNTFIEYADFRDLSVIIKTKDDKIFVERITNSKGEIDIKVNFTLSHKAAEGLFKFNKGESNKVEYRISKEALLNFSIYNFGLKDFLSNENIEEIRILKQASNVSINIEREGTNISFNNLIGEVYSFPKHGIIKIKVGDYHLKLNINFKTGNGNFEIDFVNIISHVDENLKLLELLFNGDEKNGVIFIINNSIPIRLNRLTYKDKNSELVIKGTYDFFKKLRHIEKVSLIRFENINLKKVNNEISYQIDFLYAMLTKGFFIENNKTKKISLDINQYNKGKVEILEGSNVLIIMDKKPTYKLFSKNFTFGFLTVEVVDVRLIASDEKEYFIESKKAQYIYKFHENLKEFDKQKALFS